MPKWYIARRFYDTRSRHESRMSPLSGNLNSTASRAPRCGTGIARRYCERTLCNENEFEIPIIRMAQHDTRCGWWRTTHGTLVWQQAYFCFEISCAKGRSRGALPTCLCVRPINGQHSNTGRSIIERKRNHSKKKKGFLFFCEEEKKVGNNECCQPVTFGREKYKNSRQESVAGTHSNLSPLHIPLSVNILPPP